MTLERSVQKHRRQIRFRAGLSRVLLLGIIAVISVGVFAGLFAFLAGGGGMPPDRQLEIALDLAESGDIDVAEAITNKLDEEEFEDDKLKSKKLLTVGAVQWKRSQTLISPVESQSMAEEAIGKLSSARKLGFPTGYEGFGNYCLGLAQLFVNETEEAIEPLTIAKDRYPAGRSDAIEALMEIHLRNTPPQLDQANVLLEEWKAMPGMLRPDEIRMEFAKAKILNKKGRLEESIEVLDSLLSTPKSFEARLFLGQQRLELARKSNSTDRIAQIESAHKCFRDALASNTINVSQRRTAQYWEANCLHELGRTQEALSTLSALRIGSPESVEALKSGVREIEILTQLGRVSEAAEVGSQLHRIETSSVSFSPSICDTAALRLTLLEAARSMMRQSAFESEIRLVQHLPSFCTEGDRQRLFAEAYRAWAQSLTTGPAVDKVTHGKKNSKAGAAGEPTDSVHRENDNLVLELNELAANAYDTLAQLEIRSQEYTELLWQAIEAYRDAHSLKRCNELLKTYIQNECAKRTRAYVQIGENQLSDGDFDGAITTLEQCLSAYPDDPLMFRARYVSAKAYNEKLEFAKAAELLFQNLYDGQLDPQNVIWKESLIELGAILYRQGDVLQLQAKSMVQDGFQSVDETKLEESFTQFIEAADRLEESIRRFGNDGITYRTQYLLAQSYRMAAEWPNFLLEKDRIGLEEKKQQYLQQKRELIASSASSFANLRESILRVGNNDELTKDERMLLRNAYFGEADLLFELGDYKEALTAYHNIANRFLNEPESLEALVQMARCYDALEDPVRRDQIYGQAKQILARIPSEKDEDFLLYTRYERPKWQKNLDWLAREAKGESTVQ